MKNTRARGTGKCTGNTQARVRNTKEQKQMQQAESSLVTTGDSEEQGLSQGQWKNTVNS